MTTGGQRTVLVTGASGFIAKHICLRLLNAGYRVVGSARNTARGKEARDAIRRHLDDDSDLAGRLRLVTLNLENDTGWDEAMLMLELADLAEAGFDLDITGFSTAEIERLTAALDITRQNHIEQHLVLVDEMPARNVVMEQQVPITGRLIVKRLTKVDQ